jgi:tRNA pseudouridine55 synthase
MDGVLLIDKPAGPTSHDVVARIRSISRERSVGHTGTLDPRATGLLPLVLGKATRLAAILTGGSKSYSACIRLGASTTTDDGDGAIIETYDGPLPDLQQVREALGAFTGTFQQIPPLHSAKRVGGQKAYDLARRDLPVELKPVEVSVHSLSAGLGPDGRIWLELTVSAGFYVRALARDLGRALGCGGHLETLRRTRVGSLSVEDAVPLTDAERLGADGIEATLISPSDALDDLPAVTVTEAGLKRAVHGNTLGPEHLEGRVVPPAGATAEGRVRVLGPDGRLVALAHSRGGSLHPAVVLG